MEFVKQRLPLKKNDVNGYSTSSTRKSPFKNFCFLTVVMTQEKKSVTGNE
jgi:hypothetical protein